MQVALTGARGFIGRYIVNHLANEGHALRCWYRASSNRDGFDRISDLQWIEGDLGDRDSAIALVEGCDAVVHAALYHPGMGFRGAEGDLVEFVQKNVVGTLELIEAARRANVSRFVFISTCAVHEKFVHSYGLGQRLRERVRRSPGGVPAPSGRT